MLNELLKLPALLLHLLSMLAAHLLPSSPLPQLFQVAAHVSTMNLQLLPQLKKQMVRRALGKMVMMVMKVILNLLLFFMCLLFFLDVDKSKSGSEHHEPMAEGSTYFIVVVSSVYYVL